MIRWTQYADRFTPRTLVNYLYTGWSQDIAIVCVKKSFVIHKAETKK